MTSWADPYFTTKEGHLVWDKATKLVWQRCSVGQTWNGKTCTGNAQKFTFDQAQQQAGNGWRVPTLREFSSLLYCSQGGKRRLADPENPSAFIGVSCSNESSKPTINTWAFPEFPNRVFWSSSAADGPWTLEFNTGNAFNRWVFSAEFFVLLTRDNQLSDSEAALQFPVSIDEVIRSAEARLVSQRLEEERRSKARRAAAEKSLVAGGAQSLYMKAGKAQRSGSVTVGDVSFSSAELYEMIIEKFPNSAFAVKANDQLNASNRSENSARKLNDSNAGICEAQKATCIASCPKDAVYSTLPDAMCKSRCESVSCY